MSVTTFPHLEKQLAEAVTLARSSRHHSGCVCCQYRDTNDEGFCSSQEWRAHNMIDRILGQIQRLNY